jgi:protein-S-isoprenylcysteine O-methyltransferase Ste14
MTFDLIEVWVRWLGGLAGALTLMFLFYGIWRGLERPVGSTTGNFPGLLHRPSFYILSGLGYFALCYLLWRPIFPGLSSTTRLLRLVLGTLLYFSGLTLILWGRLTLGKLYFVSTSQAAQLFADHQLVTQGPYAWVRHPMYLGILLTGLGGILVYWTWTFVFLALNFLGLTLRARREEQALAAEFGDQWEVYCKKVPRWIPRLH